MFLRDRKVSSDEAYAQWHSRRREHYPEADQHQHGNVFPHIACIQYIMHVSGETRLEFEKLFVERVIVWS
jgi:hypothetical protein